MKNFLYLITLSFLILSCNKKETTPKPTLTNLQYLTGTQTKIWLLGQGTATDGTLSIDLVSKQDKCIVDNELELKSDYTYILYEGESKCNVNDPNLIFQDKWSFLDNQTKMTIAKFNFLGVTVDNPVFTIVELNENVFRGKTQITYQGTLYNLDLKFIPKVKL